jgi:GNAT superfamily N-acetyltransferase
MSDYRTLHRADAELLVEHLLRLDGDARYARFNATTSNATLRKYVADIDWGKTRIIGYFNDGILRAVAEIRFSKIFLPKEVELAFSVEKPYQSNRVGTTLMARALLFLRNRGVRTAHIVCLLANGRMQKLALRHRADLQARSGEVFLSIKIPYGDVGSLLSEVTEEYLNWFNASLDMAVRVQTAGLFAGRSLLEPLRLYGR